MKNLNKLKVAILQKHELVTIEGGSVNPDRLQEYMEERYPTEVGTTIYN